jgi:predicted RNase H-like HicB family nuclease
LKGDLGGSRHVVRSATFASLKYAKLSVVHIFSKSMNNIKIIVERHADGYLAYPLGVQGIVVGEGESYEDALADAHSALRFHIETFGEEVLEHDSPILEASIVEMRL